MKVLPPTVGPIVGATEPTRSRIWIRAAFDTRENDPNRAFGVIRHRKWGTKTWSDPTIFKVNPNFDMTGVVVLQELKPRTRYEYQTGFFWSALEPDEIALQSASSDWNEAAPGIFRTASDRDSDSRSLIVGSCRYLLRVFGSSFFDNRGDKTFRSVIEQVEEDGRDIDQVIMMGDQIYADDLVFVAPDTTVAAFFKRYQAAFTQPHIRRLMANFPTYMILDDHEIEDNWPHKAKQNDWRNLYPAALHAYQCYQASHSPLFGVSGNHIVGTPRHWWYKYTDGCCDFFVMDSRTERWLWPETGRKKEIVSQEQMRFLKSWLSDDSGRVKIVVTSVPFFPDSTNFDRDDKWGGFPDQRAELLAFIERKEVKKVVFFSGDVHSSFSVALESPKGLKVHSVVSSAFYWPYPHPSERHFDIRGSIDGGAAGHFRVVDATKVCPDDNFTRVTVQRSGMSVEVYERKGKRLLKKSYTW